MSRGTIPAWNFRPHSGFMSCSSFWPSLFWCGASFNCGGIGDERHNRPHHCHCLYGIRSHRCMVGGKEVMAVPWSETSWKSEQMDRMIALAAIQNWLAFERPTSSERARHVSCSVPDCKVTADLINDTIRVMAGVPNVVYMCRNHYIGTWLDTGWEVRESYES